MLEWIRAALRWIGRHELGTIVAVSTVALGALVFIQLLGEVREGERLALDRLLLLSFRSKQDLGVPIGPPWLEDAVRDITALGSAAVLALLTVGGTGYLVLVRKPHAAWFFAASVVGAWGLEAVLKAVVARPRPEIVPHLVQVSSTSFPSGHSMVSAAVYLTVGALMGRFEANLVLKAYLLGWALLLTFLVGMSRVYVGVHWPSDVLAGWAAGAAWAAICWMLARALQRRGEVEPPS
jgi:undecaprenyl-diphosphatase